MRNLFGKPKSTESGVPWKSLTSTEELDKIVDLSFEKPVLIFKHSTRCSISSTALNRLERSWDGPSMEKMESFYLDLIQYRNVSNEIAERFSIIHESPQALVIENGKCVFHASHMGINFADIQQQVA